MSTAIWYAMNGPRYCTDLSRSYTAADTRAGLPSARSAASLAGVATRATSATLHATLTPFSPGPLAPIGLMMYAGPYPCVRMAFRTRRTCGHASVPGPDARVDAVSAPMDSMVAT
jgi:hypothetical protein